MSTGPNTAKRRGRNSRPGAEEGAGRSSTAPVSSPAASSSTAPASQCGWLGQLFGQCCKGDAVEPEVRVGTPEDDQRARRDNAVTTVTASRGAAGPSRAAHSEEPVAGKLGLHKPTETTGRYMIDNSILQIPSRPGVAYRYTKSETDKVKNEAGPAKWGDIVDGIDEGDGWLKVGQYYLPMTYRGIPVITAVQDSGAGQTKQPKRRAEGALSSAVSTPTPALVPAPARAATTPPSSLAAPTPASAPGGPEQGHKSKALVANSAKECEDKAATGGAPQNLGRGVQHSAKDTTPQFLSPSGTSPDVCSQPSPSQPPPQKEQKLSQQEADEKQLKLDAQRQQRELESREAAQPAKSVPWCLRPSVGTWLHRTPPKVHLVLENVPPREESSSAELWCHKPSVGTWLQRLPNHRRDKPEKDPRSEEEEEEQRSAKQGTPKAEKLASVSVDVDPFSPSTCAPESATCTPTAITGQ